MSNSTSQEMGKAVGMLAAEIIKKEGKSGWVLTHLLKGKILTGPAETYRNKITKFMTDILLRRAQHNMFPTAETIKATETVNTHVLDDIDSEFFQMAYITEVCK